MQSSTPLLIQTVDLEKIFYRGEEKIRAIDKISISISAGEFVSITGPSGSGKSTLLYILGLLDNQSAGSYRFEGVPTHEFDDDSRSRFRNERMGFIFQSFHLLPRANALRNVAMPLEYSRSHGNVITKREIQTRAEEALKRVGLQDRMKHLPNELSGGQRQRVAIARALVNNPKVIFADEPTGNLDSRNAKEIFELFTSLNADGKTILLVTHDKELASLAPRALRLRDGRVEDDVVTYAS